MCRSRPR